MPRQRVVFPRLIAQLLVILSLLGAISASRNVSLRAAPAYSRSTTQESPAAPRAGSVTRPSTAGKGVANSGLRWRSTATPPVMSEPYDAMTEEAENTEFTPRTAAVLAQTGETTANTPLAELPPPNPKSNPEIPREKPLVRDSGAAPLPPPPVPQSPFNGSLPGDSPGMEQPWEMSEPRPLPGISAEEANEFLPGPPDGKSPWAEAPPVADDLNWLPRVFRQRAQERYTGHGEPLVAGSWLNRPYYVGGFIGGISGETLIADEVNLGTGFLGGFRLGWDYDHYWGLETRLAFSEQGIDFLGSPGSDNFTSQLLLWDGSLVYYPWGDARWRPYVGLGIGIADFDYTDVSGLRRSEGVLSTPIGAGLKYRHNQYWTWRLDVTDNIIWGGQAGYETQNQLSLTAGVELRFGGTRKSYWPWNPSRRWR
ncbi:MAG: outer membrane beta-barrel protein [Pirellulales bacterium]|nr:outer membrane beta-barrel protein [Pirellulales bacterium]